MANPTPKTIPSRYATAGIAFAGTAATGSVQSIPWMPGGILIALNASVDTARTVTVTSKPKASRSNVVITAESIAFGAYHVFPRFPAQDDDTLDITGSTSDIKFFVLDTKAQPA
jgi:hypothetical protein